MAYYRRRFRRRFYRRYRKYSRWVKKPQAASSLKQMSLPIRKTFSVTFSINQGSNLSSVATICSLPPTTGPEDILVAANPPFASLAAIFDEFRIKSFGIQITPGLNTGFPPGALLICPDRKRYITSEPKDAPSATDLLVSPSTQVVGFTQFSTLQVKRSIYASSTVERQTFIDTSAVLDLTDPMPPTGVFSPAFYLAIRLAASPTTSITIPCTITMTGVVVFRNPTY